MIRIVIFIAALVVIAGGAFLTSRDAIFDVFFKLPEIEQSAKDLFVKEIKRDIITPPPLRATKEAPQALLTRAGVIAWTNTQRRQNNLEPLTENALLNQAAALKVRDMFDKQYFAHVSSDGFGPDHWVNEAGYEYIVVGENLALGNFADDKELVEAWMDSPGHRANILNARYEGIGAAVGRGTFEGRTTWLTVQFFARSLLTCPVPSNLLKAQIQSSEARLTQLQIQLDTLRVEIEAMRPKRGHDYNQKIDEYNARVAAYNTLVESTKSLVAEYNIQVTAFNTCIAQ